MSPDHRQTSLSDEPLEMPCDVLGSQPSAVLMREDQPGVMPGCAPGGAFECLDFFVSPQSVDRVIVEWDHPSPAPSFWCSDDEPSANLGDLLDNE
jgi:hypothetical protein